MATSDVYKHFDYQVTGHDSLLQHPSSDLMVIKPCIAAECEFYERSVLHPEFAVWMPEFFGCLRLASQQERTMLPVSGGDRVEEAGSVDWPSEEAAIERGEIPKEVVKAAEMDNILLQNIVHGFKEPCMMDLKIGTRQFGDDASEEKKQRMIEKAKKTTSHSMGLRITGMKVFDPSSNTYTSYPKSFGRSLTPATVLSGFLAYFFPTSASASSITSLDISLASAPTPASHPAPSSGPIPPVKKRWIIRRFIDDLSELLDTLMTTDDLVMYGSSLLLVYEGDPEALEKGWEALKERQRKEEEGDEEEGDEEGREGDEEEEEEEEPKIMDLRVIDFAHSKWTEESVGRDEGVIKGVENAIRLLRECLEVQKRDKLV